MKEEQQGTARKRSEQEIGTGTLPKGKIVESSAMAKMTMVSKKKITSTSPAQSMEMRSCRG
jgi:hypothetical protein